MVKYRGNAGVRVDVDPNITFRSRLEANYARYLNFKEYKWYYEADTFRFEDVDCSPYSYVIDFYIPELDLYAECKGWLDNNSCMRFKRLKKFHPDVFDKLIVVAQSLGPKTLKKYVRLGFSEDQIINYNKDIEKRYRNVVPGWES